MRQHLLSGTSSFSPTGFLTGSTNSNNPMQNNAPNTASRPTSTAMKISITSDDPTRPIFSDDSFPSLDHRRPTFSLRQLYVVMTYYCLYGCNRTTLQLCRLKLGGDSPRYSSFSGQKRVNYCVRVAMTFEMLDECVCFPESCYKSVAAYFDAGR